MLAADVLLCGPPAEDRKAVNLLILDAAEILKARDNLRGVAVRTPLTRSEGLSRMSGAEIFLKWENQQKTGAYKFRGAYNRICSLAPDEKRLGVITASSGNHALAVSLASRMLHVKATVVVPTSAPKVKISKIKALGAELVLKGENFDDALAHCMELAEKTGAVYVPGTEDHKVMAGQGTIACEILEDIPDADLIVAPIGGGGMISGVGTWAKHVNPRIRIIGAQSTEARAMYESFKSGAVREIPVTHTIADGLAGQISQMALDHVSKVVDDILLAEESGLKDAVLWILENEGQLIEGSAAVGPALVLQKKLRLEPSMKTAIVISGGNIDRHVVGLDDILPCPPT